MNSVTSLPRLSSRRRSRSASESMRDRASPSKLGVTGRARSVGSSSVAGASRSCSRQYASRRASRSPRRASRCQMAKSPYCTATGGRPALCPVRYASYSADSSRSKMLRDHASDATWCDSRRSTWSSSARRISVERSWESAVRSKGRRVRSRTSATAFVSRDAADRSRRSMISSATARGDRTICRSSPSTMSKVERSTSCLATMSLSARSSAGTSSVPRRRAVRGTLYPCMPGLARSSSQSTSCANDIGTGAPVSRGVMP